MKEGDFPLLRALPDGSHGTPVRMTACATAERIFSPLTRLLPQFACGFSSPLIERRGHFGERDDTGRSAARGGQLEDERAARAAQRTQGDGRGRLSLAGKIDMLICPPATLLYVATALLTTARWKSARRTATRPIGAYTGDISAAMIADCFGTHVIVGHSERRTLHGENDALVRAKAEARMRPS